MSVEYYAKLERGSLAGVSAGVLDAIARALQLDDAERVHLLRLAHEADGQQRHPAATRPPAAVDGAARPAMVARRHHHRPGRCRRCSGLHDLVGELSTRSDDFRRRWSAHNVRTHGTGVKDVHHHIVGDLTLAYQSLDLRAEPDLTMTIYVGEPNSPTAHALTLLASWVAASNGDPVALAIATEGREAR